MPFYTGLKKFIEPNPTDYFVKQYDKPKQKLESIVKNLLDLKKGIRAEGIPLKTVSDTLLLATWNLREFDSNGKKLGPRLDESFYYIAEVISSFDLVALQEIRNDIRPLKRILSILGPGRDFLVTDVTEGTSGNGERMAFVYDKSKVLFTNIAGEIVLPVTKNTKDKLQFARTPYLVCFQAGWLKLNLCTVHMFYGSDKEMSRRIGEIADLAKFFQKRSNVDNENYILLGDFNIVGRQHETMKALEKGDFSIPDQLKKTPGSNLDQSKFYDQIVYRDKRGDIKFTNKAGVFNVFKYVFQDNQMNNYLMDYNMLMKHNKKKQVSKLTPKLYKEWKSFQISDHLPLWVEFKIDFSEQYLQKLPSILRKSN
ncbi:MAG: endonuclease/exonuclease/phosphatase family protein [Cyclobacteriaceae bacterium]